MIGLNVSLLVRVAPLLSFALAGWVVGRTVAREASRFGLTRRSVADFTPSILVTALVAARLAAVAPHWRMTLAHPLDVARVTDNLSFPGGVLGAAGGLLYVSWRARLPFGRVADLFGCALPLGVAAYSAACLARNTCYGREASTPFGIVFPGLHTPRYPVELYAAALALLIYGGVQRARGRLPVGGLALLSVAALATSHALLDAFRLDASNRWYSDDRLMSAGLAGWALAMLTVLWWRTRRPDPALARLAPAPASRPSGPH